MSKKKIFNDPIYGLIRFPYEIIYDLIEHPFFQRLRRISQMGFSDMVYPGARHTRFQHALGATHLTLRAMDTLQDKGIDISEEEKEATSIAILLHDIGHGPFSHTLENSILNIHHEEISVELMKLMNEDLNGQMNLAIQIYQNKYHKSFLHQLVSSQLDMDRMDYLIRDSYFTGVAEGVIGYDRIISMLNVVDNSLVVEEKGIHSVEKFLVSRRIMYWQVYLHKTGMAAEHMLIKFFNRCKDLNNQGVELPLVENLMFFMKNKIGIDELRRNPRKILTKFCLLDDVDVLSSLKNFIDYQDFILSYLSKCILQRKLFKIIFNDVAFERDFIEQHRQKIVSSLNVDLEKTKYLLIHGTESNQAYTTRKDEILILKKNGTVRPISGLTEKIADTNVIVKYFLCYPRF